MDSQKWLNSSMQSPTVATTASLQSLSSKSSHISISSSVTTKAAVFFIRNQLINSLLTSHQTSCIHHMHIRSFSLSALISLTCDYFFQWLWMTTVFWVCVVHVYLKWLFVNKGTMTKSHHTTHNHHTVPIMITHRRIHFFAILRAAGFAKYHLK